MVWWQNVFVLIGLVLQLVGTCLAVRGLVQTWRAYSTKPLVPAWGRIKAQLRTFQASARSSLSFLLGPRQVESSDPYDRR